MLFVKSEKLNIAVIGASSMGLSHMKGVMNNENANLIAVCDTDENALAEAKEKYDIPVAVTDYRQLVNSNDIDAVIIVTPDQLHLEMTAAFLRTGKHVLCEKPMALNTQECEEMMRVQQETGNMLMIGQVCRCTPAFILAKEIVESGRIGELFFVESEYAHNYEKAEGKNSWRKTPERSGFIGGGCHAVDLLRWIAGDPTEVTAYSNHKCMIDWPTDDCTIGIYKFPNNVIGKVFVSTGCRRDYTMRTVLYGTKGTIICDNSSPEISLYTVDEPLPDGKVSYTKPQKLPVDINSHNVGAEIDLFVDALVNGKPSPVMPKEGANTVAVCCATVQSAAQDRTVTIEYPKV